MIGKTGSLWNSLEIVCLKPIVEDSNLYEKVSKTTIEVFHKAMGRSHSLLISSIILTDHTKLRSISSPESVIFCQNPASSGNCILLI